MEQTKQLEVRKLLKSKTYDEMNEEELALAVEFEIDFYKPTVAEWCKSLSLKEIDRKLHDMWLDFELADDTEIKLLNYARALMFGYPNFLANI